MMCYQFFWLLLLFSFANSKTIHIKILPDDKERELAPKSQSSDGVEETEWILETNNDYKVKISCSLKVADCLRTSLTIDTGDEETMYCGTKVVNPILRSSHKNKMIVSLMTLNTPDSAICLVSAVKSFLNFQEPHFDSSEDGTKLGPKKTNCSCGWANKASQGRIVGGKEARVNEFSFPVVIVRKDIKLAFCGGSIITAYHVLTAAHCTYKLKKNVPLIVGAGEHDLSSVKETNATQFIPVKYFINHDKFDGESKLYDISILVMKKEIQFNNIVGPVCLPTTKITLEEKFVKVMGWGRLFDHGFQSNLLMKTDLKVIDRLQCSEYYRKLKLENPHQFCTFRHGKDTCSGDSGGPVVWLDPDTNRYTQLGLVSYGKGCASEDIPGVNTDVFYFIDWIEKKIQETMPSPTCGKI